MATTEAVDELARRTVRALSKLPSAQRDVVVRRILESDPDLGAVLPSLLSIYRNAKRLRLPLRRDAVV